jgi:hypothetical protein
VLRLAFLGTPKVRGARPVTFILSVNSRETIWLLADRQLSYKGKPPKGDGRKIMLLDTTDGVAILGYAGLGATARGTEPADWMGAVLRGRKFPLEQSLGVLADALQREFPPHMLGMAEDQRVHHVVIPAFVGKEVVQYGIDLKLMPDGTRKFRYTRHLGTWGSVLRPPRIAVAGSGQQYLLAKGREWARDLLRLVKASNRHRERSVVVADYLAKLNHDVHLAEKETVGSRCVVVWRHRKSGRHKGGGAHQFYSGIARDANSAALPTIGNGFPVNAIAAAMLGAMRPQAGHRFPQLDEDALKAALALIKDTPDETLR